MIGTARQTKFIAILAIAGALISLGGCPVGDPRLTNQGGGSLLSSVAKITGGKMDTVTPDEIQIIGDTVSRLSPEVDVFITDDQAAAGVDFLVANKIKTIDDATNFVERVQEDPTIAVIPDSVLAIINSGVSLDQLVQVSGNTP